MRTRNRRNIIYPPKGDNVGPWDIKGGNLPRNPKYIPFDKSQLKDNIVKSPFISREIPKTNDVLF